MAAGVAVAAVPAAVPAVTLAAAAGCARVESTAGVTARHSRSFLSQLRASHTRQCTHEHAALPLTLAAAAGEVLAAAVAAACTWALAAGLAGSSPPRLALLLQPGA